MKLRKSTEAALREAVTHAVTSAKTTKPSVFSKLLFETVKGFIEGLGEGDSNTNTGVDVPNAGLQIGPFRVVKDGYRFMIVNSNDEILTVTPGSNFEAFQDAVNMAVGYAVKDSHSAKPRPDYESVIQHMKSALIECADIFTGMARKGHYPEALMGRGWQFILDAAYQKVKACPVSDEEEYEVDQSATVRFKKLVAEEEEDDEG